MDRQKYKTSGLKKSPPVYNISAEAANTFLSKWHYIGPVRGILYAYSNGEAVAVFTNLRSRVMENKLRLRGYKPIELARMAAVDGHTWAMSSFLALIERRLRLLQRYDTIITYSDPAAGHIGTTYKASNYTFDGKSNPGGHPIIMIDNKRISPRTMYDKHGSQSIPFLRSIYGERLTTEPMPDKDRYIRKLK